MSEELLGRQFKGKKKTVKKVRTGDFVLNYGSDKDAIKDFKVSKKRISIRNEGEKIECRK